MKIKFMNKAIGAMNCPIILKSMSVQEKNCSLLPKIKNHQLYSMNTSTLLLLLLLPANCLVSCSNV